MKPCGTIPVIAISACQTAYVRDFFAFLGIADVTFVYAEGLAISEPSRDAALSKAHDAIERLVPAYA